MEVPARDVLVQGSSGLVQLAAIAKAYSGLAQRVVSPPAAQMPIKGAGSDLLSANMPSTPCSTLVPCAFTAYPYRAENQHLVARVRLWESQQENFSLMTALWDTSHALESWQQEVEQLRTSSRKVFRDLLSGLTFHWELSRVKLTSSTSYNPLVASTFIGYHPRDLSRPPRNPFKGHISQSALLGHSYPWLWFPQLPSSSDIKSTPKTNSDPGLTPSTQF
ncbi:uncharacterized protein C8R40DRAFT_1164996 [Lentinula edodes]|uniref:uncharacterized protein n=1 Tax=Lentinula edodes TaxID=5353 RepID=UPI001E8D1388|nr:uncharacterized protein C8R40DRAFT_1164996 [Lentinula edodes]KAH7881587.1 hypothetical protein C8R40DRAFT_1164996 [Lentinula edodes]